jgi:hypothetical protein
MADVVILTCQGDIPGPRLLDGRTGDGSVGLAPSTEEPFSGTRWTVQLAPVMVDPGTEGHPADE